MSKKTKIDTFESDELEFHLILILTTTIGW